MVFVTKLVEHNGVIDGLTKADFKQLLELATKNSFFMFNGNLYQQIDGVAMGSPLGPTLANSFLCQSRKTNTIYDRK